LALNVQHAEITITSASSLLLCLRELEAAPPRKVLLYGHEAVHASAVRLATLAALRNTPVLVVDGANAFDPYEAARLARQRQRDPERLLKSIWLARAFTGHQLREIVFRLEERLETQRSLVVIMGLCTTFFDDDVAHNEAAALFYQTWWRLVQLNRQGVPVLVAQSLQPVNPRRRYFLEDLYRLSDVVLKIEAGAKHRRPTIQPAHNPLLPALCEG
jgi:hypothetical protein